MDNFAGHILRMLNFDDSNRSIDTNRELSFTMGGTRVWTKADIAIMDGDEYLLIVLTDNLKVSSR